MDLEQFREETRQWLMANAPKSMFTQPKSLDEICWGGRKTKYPADVQRWLGAPSSRGVSVETDGTRYTQWSYYYGTGELSGPSNARVKLLQVKFDRAGVVQAYNWTGDSK